MPEQSDSNTGGISSSELRGLEQFVEQEETPAPVSAPEEDHAEQLGGDSEEPPTNAEQPSSQDDEESPKNDETEEELPWTSSLKEGQPVTKEILEAVKNLERGKGVPVKQYTQSMQKHAAQAREAQERLEQLQKEYDTFRSSYAELQERHSEALPILKALSDNPQALRLLSEAQTGSMGAQAQSDANDVVSALKKEQLELRKIVEERFQTEDMRRSQEYGRKILADFEGKHAELSDDEYLKERFNDYLSAVVAKIEPGTSLPDIHKAMERALKVAKSEVDEERAEAITPKKLEVTAKKKLAGAVPSASARSTPSDPDDPRARILQEWAAVAGTTDDGFKWQRSS